MKGDKNFRILALAVSLALLVMMVIPAVPARAQSITLSPSSGSWGTKVEVTGKAFAKDSYVKLYFGNNWLKSTRVSATGAFTVYFNVPSYAKVGASYDVIVRDEYGQELARHGFWSGPGWCWIVRKAKLAIGLGLTATFLARAEKSVSTFRAIRPLSVITWATRLLPMSI